MQSKPPNLPPPRRGLSFPMCKRDKGRLGPGPSPPAQPMLPSPHPRGSSVARAREDRPQGVNARGTSGPGAHTCVRSRSNPGSRANTRPRLRRAQVQQAPGARSWGPGERGAGRAHLRVVEQPQLVEPLRGGHGPIGLRRCCTPPAATASSSAPPAGCPRPGPWAEGVTPGRSGPVLLGEVVLAPAALLLPVGRRPASCTSAAATAAPPLPGPSRGRGARREEEPEVRAARRAPSGPAPSPNPRATSASGRANLSLPDWGRGLGFQTCPRSRLDRHAARLAGTATIRARERLAGLGEGAAGRG